MEAKPLPARPSLEQYKKQAKELVKQARDAQRRASKKSSVGVPEVSAKADVDVLARVREHHPRFAKLDVEHLGRTKFALADAQLVIAREHGFESWPKFAKEVEAGAAANFAASVRDPVAEFIVAACVPRDTSHSSGTLERAAAILAAHPEVAKKNIYTAAILGHATSVKNFLARDPQNATAKGGPHGWDALTHLCFSRYLRLERGRTKRFVATAKALLDAGASANAGWWEPNHQPEPEWESVMYGAAAIAQNPELTRLLLERGGDPNDGETPYHVPETYDNTVMKILIESGKLNDASKNTLLLRKTDWHDYEGIKYLLEQGVAPNGATHWGKTAFHNAVLSDNSVEIIKVLLEHGADPTIVSLRPNRAQQEPSEGKSAVAMAARRGRGDVLETIEQHGFPIELNGVERLIAACARNDAASVQEIRERQPELVREVLADGGRLLARFAGVGNTEGVRQLLELGVNVNAVDEEGDAYFDIAKGSTALHAAAWRMWPKTVKLLLERGAQVNARDGKARTALMLAVKACVNSYWKDRRTPESVKALLEAGASADGVEFPSGYAEVDELLQQHGATAGH